MPANVQDMAFRREQTYRMIWSFTDRFGVVQGHMQQISIYCGMSYQQLSKICTEFVDMGLFSKNKHRFTLKYNPNEIPWGDEYIELRKAYLEKVGTINETKANRAKREDLRNVR